MISAPLVLTVLLATLGGCSAPALRPSPPPQIPPPAEGPAPTPAADVARSELPGRPELRARVASKGVVPYDASTLGLGGHHLAIVLENMSHAPAVLGPLHASVTAVREGVTFPCRALDVAAEREPERLAPLESHTFDRKLDCQLSLPGIYEIEVRVALGRDDPGASRPTRVGVVRIELEPRGRHPLPHPAVPGLWAMMIGDSTARPRRDEAWAGGAYTVVVALINGAKAPAAVAHTRVLFRVYKVGTTLPCMDEPVMLHAPAALASGVTYVERVPITCVMNKPGAYEIDAALLVGDDARELRLGRIGLTVGPDPAVLFPPHVF